MGDQVDRGDLVVVDETRDMDSQVTVINLVSEEPEQGLSVVESTHVEEEPSAVVDDAEPDMNHTQAAAVDEPDQLPVVDEACDMDSKERGSIFVADESGSFIERMQLITTKGQVGLEEVGNAEKELGFIIDESDSAVAGVQPAYGEEPEMEPSIEDAEKVKEESSIVIDESETAAVEIQSDPTDEVKQESADIELYGETKTEKEVNGSYDDPQPAITEHWESQLITTEKSEDTAAYAVEQTGENTVLKESATEFACFNETDLLPASSLTACKGLRSWPVESEHLETKSIESDDWLPTIEEVDGSFDVHGSKPDNSEMDISVDATGEVVEVAYTRLAGNFSNLGNDPASNQTAPLQPVADAAPDTAAMKKSSQTEPSEHNVSGAFLQVVDCLQSVSGVAAVEQPSDSVPARISTAAVDPAATAVAGACPTNPTDRSIAFDALPQAASHVNPAANDANFAAPDAPADELELNTPERKKKAIIARVLSRREKQREAIDEKKLAKKEAKEGKRLARASKKSGKQSSLRNLFSSPSFEGSESGSVTLSERRSFRNLFSPRSKSYDDSESGSVAVSELQSVAMDDGSAAPEHKDVNKSVHNDSNGSDEEPILSLQNVTAMTRVLIPDERLRAKEEPVSSIWGLFGKTTDSGDAPLSPSRASEAYASMIKASSPANVSPGRLLAGSVRGSFRKQKDGSSATSKKKSEDASVVSSEQGASPGRRTRKQAVKKGESNRELKKSSSNELSEIDKARMFAASVLLESERHAEKNEKPRGVSGWFGMK